MEQTGKVSTEEIVGIYDKKVSDLTVAELREVIIKALQEVRLEVSADKILTRLSEGNSS